MERRRAFGWCSWIALLMLLLGSAVGLAQEEEEEDAGETDARPELEAGALDSPLMLDGRLDEPAWRACADSIAGLVTVEPNEGETPSGPTVVKVLANPSELVVGIRCYDFDPRGIVAFSMERDAELDAEDHVLLVFDTFGDGRSGYVFRVNPAGARFDGLVTARGEEVSSDWDAIWEAKTARDADGWTAEIRIPIKSLAFGRNLDEWGFNLQRRVQRLQETSRWASPSADFEVFKTSRAGLLTGLPEFDLGLGLTVRPAVVGETGQPRPKTDSREDGDLSLDVTKRLGPNLLSSLTVNTDFAETEVDVRQINLTRFPLFFPEKRSFFVEGGDIFEFGLGLDEDNLIPFFSRRIGLYGLDEDEQSEVPINAGAKLVGRINETNLGALVVNTRKQDHLPVGDEGETVRIPESTMGAVRIRQDILEESALGVLVTFGDQQGRSAAMSAGVDFTYQTSNFRDEKNLLIGAWGMFNDREDLHGDQVAYGFEVDYPNDLWDLALGSIYFGEGFDPSLAFLPRTNGHLWRASVDYNPRPSTPWIHQKFHQASIELFNDRHDDRWESYTATFKPIDWLLASGERFDVGVDLEGDRPPAPFELATDVDIPRGSYEWTRYLFGVKSAEKRRVQAEVRFETGNYYNGDLNTLEGSLLVKPSARLAVEVTGERARGEVQTVADLFSPLGPSKRTKFKEELIGGRLQINVSPDLQLSSLTQYDTQSGSIGSNNRLRWTVRPQGEVFLVYNHNWERTLKRDWRFDSRKAVIKLQYAFLF